MRIPLGIKIAVGLFFFIWSTAMFVARYKEQQVYLHGDIIKAKIEDIELVHTKSSSHVSVNFYYSKKSHSIKIYTDYIDGLEPGDTIALKHMAGSSIFTPTSGYDTHYRNEYISMSILFIVIMGCIIGWIVKYK